ncbi:MAG: Na(+)-translocating NADH-quinone reductase subunit C [Phycisphaerae bacterium]|nr:Na(+)-translocating NADH-quinone reductase subunit C [Phycisphaerae bacterium]
MSQKRNATVYTIGFTAAVCIVCSLVVSTTAVTLKPRQAQNALLDRQKNIIQVAGLIEPGEDPGRDDVQRLFDQFIDPVVVELATGAEVDVDPLTFDQAEAARDPARSRAAPPNAAGVTRVPLHGIVYRVMKDGAVEKMILPIEGKGLWSTLYGFLALDADARTIRGITFYQHGETPGLGGEVDNPAWKARWANRKAFDEQGEIRIEVLKKAAGPPEEDPYHVDGLSSATLTSRGVNHLVRFWLGEDGFKPYLERYNASRSQAQ